MHGNPDRHRKLSFVLRSRRTHLLWAGSGGADGRLLDRHPARSRHAPSVEWRQQVRASLIVLCLVLAYRKGHPRGETAALREALSIAVDALWGLVTLAIIRRVADPEPPQP